MSKKSEESSEERVVIGKIVGVHGVNGTMLLLPLTDYPDRFLKMKKLTLERPGAPIQTVSVKKITPYVGKETFFLQIPDVTERTLAESFKGSFVTVSKEERVELSEDEYWIDDIIGLKVIDNETGFELGLIEEVLETGSNDVYLIRTEAGEVKPIPALAEAIVKVDTQNGVMLVTLPEGL